ncbi:MAG TPA: GNAT family N-acetyltransferase [Candidatus Limnocylindrales bacterium]|nr:GNAT family N-acetyltransferase [Candidatus Limnocylindrales bacterium]
MTLWPDEREVRRLELHEARVHAMRPGRHVRELADGVVLYDETDPDPFWNRLATPRLPADEKAFRRRLDEVIVYFATLSRRPHLWASPGYHQPPDLERRLREAGFVDLGRGLLMALTRPERSTAAATPAERGITVERLRGERGDRNPTVAAEVALVAAEAFAADSEARSVMVDDVLGLLARVEFAAYLVRADGEPAAVAKATTFDGATYLSTIGTRPRFRGRGLAALATAAAARDAQAAGSAWIYLGVFESNLTARRLYDRLGFEDVGEAAGDWLL